jgi:hypothetical protein
MLQEAAIAAVVVVVVVEVESVEMMVAMEVAVVRQAVMVTQMGGEVEAKKGSMVVETVTTGIRALEEGLQKNTCFSGQLSANFSAKGSPSVGAFGVVYKQISSGYSGSTGSGTLICGTKSEPTTLLGSNSIISN